MADTAGLKPLPPFDALAGEWVDLENRSNGSFFTSWTWIGSWLKCVANASGYPADLALLTVSNTRPFAMAVIARAELRNWPIGGAIGFINQVGRQTADSLWIEYNDLLCEAGKERQAVEAVLSRVSAGPAANADGFPRRLRWAGIGPATYQEVRSSGAALRTWRESDCRWIDLDTDGGNIDSYYSRLSRNSRQQIRRSMRLLFGDDLPRLRRATRESLQDDLAKFKKMHIAAWRARGGHDGAFANPLFEPFLAELASSGLDNANVEILSIGDQSDPVGMLVNLVYRGSVYAYQSAFRYQADNRIKPGLATHAAAIADYGARGMTAYRFMDGAGRYKESLGTKQEKLYWIDIARPGVASQLAFALDKLWRGSQA